tara:strand:+ start:47 stop:151 length:105 start_codon:yes stop_codon:yes gene_type:complete
MQIQNWNDEYDIFDNNGKKNENIGDYGAKFTSVR